MTEKTLELLPLGTALKIKDDESLYIIISRGFQKKDGKLLAGYAGVPHPYGESKKYKTVMIATADILEVVQRGYEDELDRIFIQEQVGNAVDAPKQSKPSSEELTMPVQKAEVSTVSQETPIKKEIEHPHDPFYNLKQKAKEMPK